MCGILRRLRARAKADHARGVTVSVVQLGAHHAWPAFLGCREAGRVGGAALSLCRGAVLEPWHRQMFGASGARVHQGQSILRWSQGVRPSHGGCLACVPGVGSAPCDGAQTRERRHRGGLLQQSKVRCRLLLLPLRRRWCLTLAHEVFFCHAGADRSLDPQKLCALSINHIRSNVVQFILQCVTPICSSSRVSRTATTR